MFTTSHGTNSMWSRLGTSKKNADAQALEVINKGLPREETGGNLRRFIDKKYFSHDSRGSLFVWRNFLWIFDRRALITCYSIPGNLVRDVNLQMKKWQKRKTAR